MLRSLLATKESVKVYFYSFSLHVQYFRQLFPWVTLKIESATSIPVFFSNSCMPSLKAFGLLETLQFLVLFGF